MKCEKELYHIPIDSREAEREQMLEETHDVQDSEQDELDEEDNGEEEE